MKKYFTKEYILLAVSVFTTLFCIVGLSFDLVGTKLNSSRYIENGFMLLDFNSFFITSSYGWATILLGIINWITLVTCVALGALAIVGHFRIKTKSRPIYLSSIIVSLIFSALYLIEGAVYKSINSKTLDGNFYTIAYIPFIICALLFAAFIFVWFKMPEKPAEKSEHNLSEETNFIDKANS